MKKQVVVPVEHVERRILLVRGHKVMLDSDLAELYGVLTKRLNEQVRRNMERFPEGFMFQLTTEEYRDLRYQFGTSSLRSQFATSSSGYGGRRYLPMVFTEQGVAMLSSVLHSKRAIQVNIAIMKTFVRIREMLATHRDLAEKLEALERKYDGQFKMVFDAIRELVASPPSPRRRIGFYA
ncbi:MAG: ORF6N domain-containing protein [Candidatus Omnitrophica bacterium]|nr:ORF6N domain-containing protein [Candidatus Omnitrophota bacterium]